jgi:hypothetical protein
MTAWPDLLPPASMELPCQGDTHIVTWQAGRLVLHHHDVAAERALIALGGEQSTCLDVVDLWEHREEDWKLYRTVLVGALAEPMPFETVDRVQRDSGVALERLLRSDRTRGAQGRSAGARRAQARARSRRALVRHLPVDLRLRLALDAAATCAERPTVARWPGDDLLDTSLLRVLLLPAVRAATEASGLRPSRLGVGCRLARPAEGTLVTGGLRGARADVFARLTLRWIPEVWAPGLASVGPWLVAEVLERTSPTEVRARACHWVDDGDDGAQLVMAELVATSTDGRWRAVEVTGG